MQFDISEWGEDIKTTNTHKGQYFMRFMGAIEYYRLIEGVDLENTCNHTGKRTDSRGFCFLPIKDVNDEDFEIVKAFEFLSGIVSNFVCVVFECTGADLTKGYGVYADPYGGWWDRITVTEYSVTEYNRDTMCPVRAYFYPENYNMPEPVAL